MEDNVDFGKFVKNVSHNMSHRAEQTIADLLLNCDPQCSLDPPCYKKVKQDNQLLQVSDMYMLKYMTANLCAKMYMKPKIKKKMLFRSDGFLCFEICGCLFWVLFQCFEKKTMY